MKVKRNSIIDTGNCHATNSKTIQYHYDTSTLGTVHQSQGFMFLVSLILFLVAGHDAIPMKMPFLIMGSVALLTMLYGCLYLSKLRFIITAEQLIIQHGVFHRSSDYIELYRIVDFSEQRDILEQLFGLKTVSIYSGDRTNPKLDIYGVQEKVNVVGIIRERVEYNKQRRGVYVN